MRMKRRDWGFLAGIGVFALCSLVYAGQKFGGVEFINGSIILKEKAAPATPSSTFGHWYVATDGTPHFINDAGTDTNLAGVGAHTILDGGTVHSDTATDTVSRGSLIYGNATPAWDELPVGTAGQVLTTTDGVDVSWQDPTGGSGGFTVGLPVSSGVASVSSTTYPAFTTNASGIPYIAFDGATQEALQWNFVLPGSYASGSNLTVKIEISSASTSQATSWGLRMGSWTNSAISTAPGTILDTVQVVTGTTSGTANTSTTITWTLANADIGSPTAGDQVMLQLDRQAASAEDSSSVDVFVNGSLAVTQ